MSLLLQTDFWNNQISIYDFVGTVLETITFIADLYIWV